MFNKIFNNLKGDSTRAKMARGFIAGTVIGALINSTPEEPYSGEQDNK